MSENEVEEGEEGDLLWDPVCDRASHEKGDEIKVARGVILGFYLFTLLQKQITLKLGKR